jgi:hypothetical protein
MPKRSTIALSVTALIAATALGLLGLVAPVGAIATSADVAATHAYIQANYALARAAEAEAGGTQASVVLLNQRFGRECPDVGAGSPQNEESQKLSYEAAGALWSAGYGANAGPIRAFVRKVKPLRWSNPKLTRIARSYARSLLELATLALPDLCGDVRAWSASGFRTVPAATLHFDEHVEAITGHSIPPRLLAPYEQPGDRGALERTTRLEAKLEATEITLGFEDWTSLLETVGLNQ